MLNYSDIDGESGHIELPQISRVLIIGASDTAFKFSKNIQNIGLFEKIQHVATVDHAIRLFQEDKFAVIVIDNDSPVDTISASRLIHINDEFARIILISSKFDANECIQFKNKGSIHGYLPIPNSDLLVHSLIIKEQSVYQLNHSLMEIIRKPPKFSNLYNLLNQEKRQSSLRSFRFVGLIVLKDTVTVYENIIDDKIEIDSLLISSYLSAVSIYGSEIFSEKMEYPLTYIDLNNISIFIKDIQQFQYLFLVEKKTQDNLDEIVDGIHTMITRIQVKFEDYFESEFLSDNREEEFNNELTKMMRYNYEDDLIFNYDQKPTIANFNPPDDKLIQVFDETFQIYDVHDFVDDLSLTDFLAEEICNVIILNDIIDELDHFKGVIKQVKSRSPFTQIIVTTDQLDVEAATTLLNLDGIDKILSTNFELETYFRVIKNSVKKGIEVRELSNLRNHYRFFFSSNKFEIIKTILRNDGKSIKEMTIPRFMGIVILRGTHKFYSKFFDEENTDLDEDVLIGFINSLMAFSHEYSNNTQMISSVKFGPSRLILEKIFDFTFIYFIGELDQSNIEYTQKYLNTYSTEIYGEIINGFTIDHYKKTPDLNNEVPVMKNRIHQHCNNMMIELSIL